MDVEHQDHKEQSSAKVIAFARTARRPVSGPATGCGLSPAEQLVRQALIEAAKDSDWGIMQQDDIEALESEHAFRRRFGFIVNREQRRRTLELKHEKDLTDPEIRRLRWSGSLDLKSEPARILASNFVQGFGYAMVALVFLQMLLGILAVVRAETLTVTGLVAVTAIEAILVCMLASAYYAYIEPSQVCSRIRQSGR